MENFNNREKNNFNIKSEDLLVFAWNKRIVLLIIAVVTFIITSIITLFIPNMYKSTIIMYPAPKTPISKYLFTDQFAGSTSITAFGEEEESEQLLQIVTSDRIKNKIINKYNLMKHYRIPENYKYKRTLLMKKYDKYIKAKRTKLRSIIVEVLDFNPDTSAYIANDIAAYVDSVMFEIKKERAEKLMSIIEKEYLDYIKYVEALEDSLEEYRKKGILDYNTQSEVLTEMYATALTRSNYKAAEEIKKKLDILEKYGGKFNAFNIEYIDAKNKLGYLRTKYNEAKAELMTFIPQKYLVDRAEIPEKKSYPKRSLIVIQAVIGVLFFSFLMLFINEKIIKNQSSI